jgi:hypothetical protein
LKLNCTLQGGCTVTNFNQPKVTNTSNLSLDRDPTGRNTNSRKIQGWFAHFLDTCRLLPLIRQIFLIPNKID